MLVAEADLNIPDVPTVVVDKLGLGGNADQITLEYRGETIDQVAWTEDPQWPSASGRPVALDTTRFEGERNDNGLNWCLGAEAPMALVNPEDPMSDMVPMGPAGTPGPPTHPARFWTTSHSPRKATLTISELMVSPADAPGAGEWIEIQNTSTKALRLDGLTIGDGESEGKIKAPTTTLAPGQILILAATDEVAAAIPGSVRFDDIKLRRTGQLVIRYLNIIIVNITWDASVTNIIEGWSVSFDSDNPDHFVHRFRNSKAQSQAPSVEPQATATPPVAGPWTQIPAPVIWLFPR